jgi:thiamine-phosphate pyrophosphorylase
MRPLSSCRLDGILDGSYTPRDHMPAMLSAMLAGGVHIVQLRAKSWSPDDIIATARSLHPLTKAAGVPFVINDYPEAARAAGVEGAHVGQDDLSIAEARQLAGPGIFIGKSTHSLAQAHAAFAEGADCIGFGPLFATPTKPDYQPIGTLDIRTVNTNPPVPVFCIGGINLLTLPAVLAAGAHRVVIVSAILSAKDPTTYSRTCLDLIESSPIPEI